MTRCSTCSSYRALKRRYARGEYSDLDAPDTAGDMLAEMSRLAEGPIAVSFVDGDRNPPVFDPQNYSLTLSPLSNYS